MTRFVLVAALCCIAVPAWAQSALDRDYQRELNAQSRGDWRAVQRYRDREYRDRQREGERQEDLDNARLQGLMEGSGTQRALDFDRSLDNGRR